MGKRLANITVTLLLSIPVFSLISAVLRVDKILFDGGYELSIAADAEDQDDSTQLEDDEFTQDDTLVEERYSLLVLEPTIRQTQSRQEFLFQDTHLEVITPPPRG